MHKSSKLLTVVLVQHTVTCRKLKCPYNQQGFCGFGISITSKNILKPKKTLIKFIPIYFAIKPSFKLPALATPNDADHNERLVTNDVTSGTSQ